MSGGGPGAADPDGPLTSPSVVAGLLAAHGLRTDKRFGQNFLTDRSVLESIVAAADLGPEDAVLEVGAGLGVLTQALSTHARHVTSLELDARLLPVLAHTLRGRNNVTLVEADALRYDLNEVEAGSVLVANLPYNIGTAVVARALESGRFRRLVFLVQLEVADRLQAAPGSAAYGSLSLLVAHFGVARVVRKVAAGAFFPPPKVTSAVVRIDGHADAVPHPALFKLIHTSFAHRRKTLVSNLRYAGHEAATVQAVLASLDLDVRVRAEALSLDDFGRLLVALNGMRHPREAADAGILP